MASCLIALGSNLGDREATLCAAIDALSAVPGVQLLRHSQWRRTKPVGGIDPRQEFLNGAALLETSRPPEVIHKILHQIEADHGRQRHRRWADRTLDLDLLLYGPEVIDTPTLTVPHPRMSFRRFVLEPAAEIAGSLVHPMIGWTLEQLLHHLNAGADCVAIVSPQEPARRELAAMLVEECGAAAVDPPVDDVRRWPPPLTTWLAIPTDAATTIDSATYAAASFPKLTILLDPPAAGDAAWAATVQQTGRGPTLQVPAAGSDAIAQEASAAVEVVWSRLGPLRPKRLQ